MIAWFHDGPNDGQVMALNVTPEDERKFGPPDEVRVTRLDPVQTGGPDDPVRLCEGIYQHQPALLGARHYAWQGWTHPCTTIPKDDTP